MIGVLTTPIGWTCMSRGEYSAQAMGGSLAREGCLQAARSDRTHTMSTPGTRPSRVDG
jgi:hypothetical protein